LAVLVVEVRTATGHQRLESHREPVDDADPNGASGLYERLEDELDALD